MGRHRNSREIFHLRLKELGYSSYSEYLRSAHWAEFRRRFYASGNFGGCCWACGKTTESLSLHHRTYKRLGYEYLMDVVALCSFCHSRSHPASGGLWGAVKKIKRRNMKRLGRKGNFRAPKIFTQAVDHSKEQRNAAIRFVPAKSWSAVNSAVELDHTQAKAPARQPVNPIPQVPNYSVTNNLPP